MNDSADITYNIQYWGKGLWTYELYIILIRS